MGCICFDCRAIVCWLSQEVFTLPSHLAIVMSHCNGGDLATLIGDRLDRGVSSLQPVIGSTAAAEGPQPMNICQYLTAS